MHKNYYLFKSQVLWLRGEVLNSIIEECFTFKKSELVLKLYSNQHYFLNISVDSTHPYIILSKSHNIKESKVNLFKELNGQQIVNLYIDKNDKVIFLNLEKYTLQAIFFGSAPNIVLSDLDNVGISKFKKDKSIATKREVTSKLPLNNIDQKKLNTIIQQNPNLNVIKFLTQHIRGFNFTLSRETCFKSNIDFNTTVNNLSENDIPNLIENIKNLELELKHPIPIIYYINNIPKNLSIIDLKHFKGVYQPKQYSCINEAWKYFIHQSIDAQEINKSVKISFEALNKRIKYLKSSLLKIQEFEKLEERKSISELKGNLLLTFISEIPKGTKSVNLKNIFSNNSETIQIKLNPAKTVQENAQKYFEKFKNIDTQKERITNRKNVIKNELNTLNKIRDKYSQINSKKEALSLHDILIKKNLVKSTKAMQSKNENLEYYFRKILLLDKWNIYIGKNDKNNDLLTFKFANKFDWWFHAQGVPGSHTIVHLQNKNENLPMNIIEQVASVAAYHSAAKHSKSVPVIYTQIRYVKKMRKANPGTVSVLQHKTIFVEPKNL